MDALHLARRSGLEPNERAWRIQRVLLEFLESGWEQRDNGIWEVRGPKRHFIHSKVMAWVAMDGAVKAVERWQRQRKTIHEQVCQEGFDPGRNAFVQYYGSKDLDDSLLWPQPTDSS